MLITLENSTHILNHHESKSCGCCESVLLSFFVLHQHWNSAAVKNGVWFKQKFSHIQEPFSSPLHHCVREKFEFVVCCWLTKTLIFFFLLAQLPSRRRRVDCTGGKFIQLQKHQSNITVRYTFSLYSRVERDKPTARALGWLIHWGESNGEKITLH